MPILSALKRWKPRHSSPASNNIDALRMRIALQSLGFAADNFPKMIRSIALAAILGALVAAGVLYSASEPDWRKAIAIWLGASGPTPAAKLATEDWPICSTMGSMGSEADWAQLDPDFAAGKKGMVAG